MKSGSQTLPASRGQNYKTKKDFYHISFASECQRCFETCVKPRRLPCEHEFCKSCLKDYFNKEIEDDIALNTFPCPACDTPTEKPLAPKTKWTKAFKIDKTSSFYTERPVSTSSLGKRLVSLNRFGCKISSEPLPCAFWGGDVLPSGNIVLPDWYNQSVKLFSDKGKLLAHSKFENPPLDVTGVQDDTILVSYGRVSRNVTFLHYDGGKLYQGKTVDMGGNFYNTTRLGTRCLGILQLKDGKIVLATVSAKGTVRYLDTGQLSESLSSSSGIRYDKPTKRIFLTEKSNFMCIDSGGKLLFEKSFPLRERDHYLLGSVNSDNHGNVYVASDECVLRTDVNGDLCGVLNTTVDPFHIMVSHDSTKLFVVGRNDRVEICPTDFGLNRLSVDL